MSKQVTRQRTRQERRRAARRKRITTAGIIAAGVLLVAGLVYLVIAQVQTPANAAYPTIDGVSCDSGEHSDFHIHAHMSIYIWGKRFPQLNYPSQLSDPSGWQVYVNGKPYTGNFQTIPLQSHTLITLAYNSPGVKPDTTFDWNGL